MSITSFGTVAIGVIFICNDMAMCRIDPVNGFNAQHIATGTLYYIPPTMRVVI